MFQHLLAKDDDYTLAAAVFLRLLGVIYFIAFFSLSVQVVGLVGQHGILPFNERLSAYFEHYGYLAWLLKPTLFWFSCTDWVLRAATYAGCFFSVLLFFGRWQRLSLVALFMLYLSLFHAGQTFLSFQWDSLLLETGFLSIFLVGGPSRLLVFLFHWLLFRLRFMSGIAKLASGDPVWANFSALNDYFETQPLPHIGSWYFHQLPTWLHQAGVGLVFFSELIVPFFIFLPRRFRLFAAAVTVLMQVLIIASSNHNWINFLTILLCLFLLDDALLKKILPAGIITSIITSVSGKSPDKQTSCGCVRYLLLPFALIIILSSISVFVPRVVNAPLPPPFARTAGLVQSWGMGFSFHVFPTMQTQRHELQVEGSYDGKNWQAYRFRYKPGPLMRAPVFNLPHQPRLDWMIWFVPPQHPEMMYWFGQFLERLHEGREEVTALLEYNPFEEKPPVYIRVLVFDYHFTTPAERGETGRWWNADYLGLFPYVQPRYP